MGQKIMDCTLASYLCKIKFIRTQLDSFIYKFSMAPFASQQQNGVIMRETV